MYKPPVIAFDYETSSLDFWSKDFDVISCAFAWRGSDGEVRTRLTKGPDETGELLRRIALDGIPVVVHNLGFEYGVTRFQFPDVELDYTDTMRLAQVFDNGADDPNPWRLSSCVKRILKREDHKEKYYEWLRTEAGVKKGQEGSNLQLLPEQMFHDYNVEDAVETLYLYEHTTQFFQSIGYDWTLDHLLYTTMTKHIALAQAAGVRVSRGRLGQNTDVVIDEIKQIDREFREMFKDEIEDIEAEAREAWVSQPKTDKGRANRRKKLDEKPEIWRFNPKSMKQLKELFVDRLGLEPVFFTPKGSPSFKASHLPTYGEGGKHLANRNKRLLVLQQMENLHKLSEDDSRWHLSLKTVGTATGRGAGGSIGS